MKRAIVTLGLLAALIGSSLFPVAAPVLAADNKATESITLSPAVSRPVLDAGGTMSGKITIINDGTSDYSFLVYARPYSVTGEQYDPNYTVVNEKTQAYQWVEFTQTKFKLAAGQKVDVPYSVNVPKNAAGGGHYAVLFAETQPEDVGEGSSVMRKKRVGSLLYMTVNGRLSLAGSVESWDARTWQTSRPLTSTLRLKNNGNTHFQADIQVNYTDLLGKKRFELNKQLFVLPGTTRRIPVEWADAPIIGIYKASGTVSYLNKSETLPARYIVLLPVYFLAATVAVILFAAILIVIKRRKSRPLRLS